MSKILSSINHAASYRKRWMWLLVAAVYAVPFMMFSGFGAFDTYLKIEGVPGESLETVKHKDWIEIDSFSFALKGAQASGGGTGKASFQDISIRKHIDKSSPLLMLKCCTGEHIPEAVLEYSKAVGAGTQAVFLKIKMSDLLISSYGFSGAGGTVAGGTTLPVDSLSLNFTKIEMTYIPYDAAGAPGQPVTAVCDLSGPTP